MIPTGVASCCYEGLRVDACAALSKDSVLVALSVLYFD